MNWRWWVIGLGVVALAFMVVTQILMRPDPSIPTEPVEAGAMPMHDAPEKGT
ncbi:MAG: hypothetical protein ACK4XJ_11315 [Fimbriimonadaceae bacterium]